MAHKNFIKEEEEQENITVPQVSDELIEPKIRIYDLDGSYWFNKIGFNRKITDEK